MQRYAPALENPPLLIVCDLARFEIHTNWTNTVSHTYEIALDDLADPRNAALLKWTFADPEQLKPGLTRQTLTEEAAAEFARLAQRLRDRGHRSEAVAHFINRLVFCMFAEDVDLLPGKMFGRMLEGAARAPDEFAALASSLFAAPRTNLQVPGGWKLRQISQRCCPLGWSWHFASTLLTLSCSLTASPAFAGGALSCGCARSRSGGCCGRGRFRGSPP